MKLRSIRIVSNIIIVTMFITLIVYMTTSNYSYVFSYENSDVIYNGNRESNKVSLMVNVYWGTEYIEPMLNIFEEYGVNSTFFVGGSWVEDEEEMLYKIIDKGHEIGNHGFFHKDHKNLSYSQNLEEIKATHNLVKVTTGISMNIFAPPSGSFNKATIDSANELGYKTIMWSKDTIDWRDQDANTIFDRATNNIKGGDLILMHPTEMTIKALPLILEYYRINNIKTTTVSNCLK